MSRLFEQDYKGTNDNKFTTYRKDEGMSDNKETIIKVQASHMKSRLHLKMTGEEAHYFVRRYKAVVVTDRVVKLEVVPTRCKMRGVHPGAAYETQDGPCRNMQFTHIFGDVELPLFGKVEADIIEIDGELFLYLPEFLPVPTPANTKSYPNGHPRAMDPDPIPEIPQTGGKPDTKYAAHKRAGTFVRQERAPVFKTHLADETHGSLCRHAGSSPMTDDPAKVTCAVCEALHLGEYEYGETRKRKSATPDPVHKLIEAEYSPSRDELKAAIRVINLYKRGPDGDTVTFRVDSVDGIVRAAIEEIYE